MVLKNLDCGLLNCDAMQSYRLLPKFQRDIGREAFMYM
jgi:hypothetical protein